MALPGIAAGAASGVLLWLASPAVGAAWLVWVALVPAAAVALAARDERASRLAVPVAYAVYLELLLVPALPFGLTDGQWDHGPLPVLIGGSPVIVVALVAVPLFAAALYGLRFGQVPATDGRAGLAALALVPATAWVALDFLRTSIDPGGLFGPLYLSQHDSAAVAASALGGPWLLTFAVVASGYALAALLMRGGVRLGAAGVAAVLAAGIAMAAAGPPGGGEGGLTVAAVQPGYDTAEEDRPELRFFEPGSYGAAAADTVDDLEPLTVAAAARGAQVIVWPEAAIWVPPADAPFAGPALRRLARRTGAAVVVPSFLPGPRHNFALAFRSDGTASRVAPKQRPMWFLGERPSDTPGGRPLALPPAQVGTLLGVDNQAPGLAAALADRGARLLASSTHDWEQLARHQRAAAQVHAAATGMPLVRADWRYGSAIYDAGGRQVADAGSGKRRTLLVAEVEAAPAPTLYARTGDWLAWLCLGVSAAGWAVAAVRRRRPHTIARPW